MKKYTIMAILGLAFLASVTQGFAMSALSNSELDMITAGTNYSINNSSVNRSLHGIDNSISINNSIHNDTVVVQSSSVENRGIVITIGNENTVVPGINVLGVIGRSPGRSSSSGSSPNLGGLQSIKQMNIIGYP